MYAVNNIDSFEILVRKRIVLLRIFYIINFIKFYICYIHTIIVFTCFYNYGLY